MESNLRHKQREEQEAASSSSQASAQVEFATPEGAIAADREQTVPPPEIAERLNESIAAEPKPANSFWSKLGFKK
jgi:hypothetical protein